MSKKAISRILFFVGLAVVIVPSWFGAAVSREMRLATCIAGLVLIVGSLVLGTSSKKQ